MTPFTNWNRSAASEPRTWAEPASEDEVVAIVRDAARYPSPVRAVGALHSTTPCIEADGGTQLVMRRLDHVRLEDGGRRITVGAGVDMLEVRDALRGEGRELAVSPEIGNATAGSVATSGSKDSSLRTRGHPAGLAQIGSTVVSVRMVDARGDVLVVDETGATAVATGRRDPGLTLGLVRSSYGLCGIVTEVTFETAPLTPLDNRFDWLPFRDGRIPSVREIFTDPDGQQADAVLAFLQPYHGGVLVERRKVAREEKLEFTVDDRMRREVRDWIWEWGASGVTTFLAGTADLGSEQADKGAAQVARSGAELLRAALTDNPLTRPLFKRKPPSDLLSKAASLALAEIPPAMRRPARRDHHSVSDDAQFAELLQLFDRPMGPFFEHLVRGYRAYRSDSLVDFTHDRDTFFDFTFWAFPERDWDTLVPAYVEFCREFARDNGGFRPALFTEVYFISQDARSWPSFSPDGPVFTLDMVHSVPNDETWKTMNVEYNRWAAGRGGRPLLDQTKQLDLTPEVLARACGEPWHRFREAVWAANPPLPDAPDGRFVGGGFFQTLLGPRPPA